MADTPNDAISTSGSADVASRIFELREQHVILAAEVAAIFGVETRQVVQNIKKNPQKFGERYAFQISKEEQDFLRSSGVISKPGRGGSRALPWVLTQKGAIRLATLMDAPKAIEATDTFIDIFTEVLTQIYQGKDRIQVAHPSRVLAATEDEKHARELRKKIAEALTELMDTVVDRKTNTTVKDELGEVANDVRSHLSAWLKTRKTSNEKVEAETLLLLEKTRDLFERRQTDLQGAVLDRESKALANMEKKIELVERLLRMHERLEPNAVIGMLGNFPNSGLALPPKKSKGRKKNS